MIESDPNFSTEQRRLLATDESLQLCDCCDHAKRCEDDGFGNRFCKDCREENNE